MVNPDPNSQGNPHGSGAQPQGSAGAYTNFGPAAIAAAAAAAAAAVAIPVDPPPGMGGLNGPGLFQGGEGKGHFTQGPNRDFERATGVGEEGRGAGPVASLAAEDTVAAGAAAAEARGRAARGVLAGVAELSAAAVRARGGFGLGRAAAPPAGG